MKFIQLFRPGNGDTPPRAAVVEKNNDVEYATPYAREPEEKVSLGATTTTTIADLNAYSKFVKLHLTTKPNVLTLSCMINPFACIPLFASYNKLSR